MDTWEKTTNLPQVTHDQLMWFGLMVFNATFNNISVIS
jgi:hypothetical protein